MAPWASRPENRSCFVPNPRLWLEMLEPPVRLTPADPNDLADALAFALRFDGRRGKGDAAEFMADIVAKRLVRHLERAGFVVMKRPPGMVGRRLGGDSRADRK